MIAPPKNLWKSSNQDTKRHGNTHGEQLNNFVEHGGKPLVFPAKTVPSGGYLLNPRFTLWLQGYPAEWLWHAVSGTL
jgi:hypothetical protein